MCTLFGACIALLPDLLLLRVGAQHHVRLRSASHCRYLTLYPDSLEPLAQLTSLRELILEEWRGLSTASWRQV
jgi:hypothetical protein